MLVRLLVVERHPRVRHIVHQVVPVPRGHLAGSNRRPLSPLPPPPSPPPPPPTLFQQLTRCETLQSGVRGPHGSRSDFPLETQSIVALSSKEREKVPSSSTATQGQIWAPLPPPPPPPPFLYFCPVTIHTEGTLQDFLPGNASREITACRMCVFKSHRRGGGEAGQRFLCAGDVALCG